MPSSPATPWACGPERRESVSFEVVPGETTSPHIVRVPLSFSRILGDVSTQFRLRPRVPDVEAIG